MKKDKFGRIRFSVDNFRFYVTKAGVYVYKREKGKEMVLTRQKQTFLINKYDNLCKKARMLVK